MHSALSQKRRLSIATLGSMRGEIARPAFRLGRPRGGIVHLGIGAFHRAHQAVYTDDALAAGDEGWGITAVSLRSPAVRDLMVPQDNLYTVMERSGQRAAMRVIGAVEAVYAARENPAAVLAALASPTTHIVTLTVTEKGYCRQAGSNQLDYAQAAQPGTIYTVLAAGLAQRKAAGCGGVTLVSCDNLPGNGHLLAELLAEYLERDNPSLAAWTARHVACPDTVVDRIVPAVTRAEIDALAERTGLIDRAMVVTEPFRQWVIQNRFAGPRPRWEAGGAQFVDNVHAFETAKLRLLNGSHSTLAYFGIGLGFDFVHEAVADPALNSMVQIQMMKEAAPCLPRSADLDPGAYGDALLRRFANPALDHRLKQIAMDGSQKIPQRWLATMIERDKAGQGSAAHMLSLAAWAVHTRGRSANGASYKVDDPLADRLRDLWREAGSDIDRLAGLFIDKSGVFPTEFGISSRLRQAFPAALRSILECGWRPALDAFLSWHEGQID
ncbi:mannitol dehydrogenase family protein [Caenibius sp. WL]|uniref:mannitol dehydrogenase family protein n=1 Tax=Caenibius sp. WL TaxID=2872646 RepID=UPI001C9966FD|nr:mannitol dehydrogenase family protein [Caenibius sp. WL]